MILAILLSLVAPQVGGWVKHNIGNSAVIVVIFALCGWEAKIDEMRFGRKTIAAFAAGALVALVLSPWMAVALSALLRLDDLATVGLVVISSVPPTLSTGVVMTKNASGNSLLAMTVTLGYNVLGVFTMPLMLTWCLAGHGDFDAHPLNMFANLFLVVILPFVCGCLARRMLHFNLPKWFGLVPSLCVVLLLLSFFADSGDMLRKSPLALLLISGFAGLILHGILLAIIWFGGAALRFVKEDRKALLFTAGSKTISITLATLAILKADDGPAAVPCMVFYVVQMLLDSCIAGRMGGLHKRA